MFIKAILTIIFSPIILMGEIFNLSKPEIYTAPQKPIDVVREVPKVKTTPTKPTSTPVMKSTNTPKVVKTATTTKPVEKPPIIVIAPETPVNFEKINMDSRKTIVNILCTTKYGDLSPISGTGVIIGADGLILTNAHIAQYFLLKDFREKNYLKCIARTGSPAYPKYNLELVYISPNWVAANKTLLKEQDPKGTGEDDFAFLRITNAVDGSKLPDYLTYIEPNTREIINKGENVLLVSYPAGFLGGLSILQDLSITSAVTNIQDVFTFKDGTIDVLAVGGTVVSQKGSSGGLVVDSNTSLIGIITTSSDGNTTSNRGLNAITISYINRTLESEISMKLKQFLELDHNNFAKTFANTTVIKLTKLISDELLK